ncbi:hypothetical protein BaRGS_00009373 [Batillaria attramentaria]|uniref:Uncharacterized protein n=1 Tax=Batillaria attramentaria TaxID=370345 RepID=A0ABD0LJW1_9CAEN
MALPVLYQLEIPYVGIYHASDRCTPFIKRTPPMGWTKADAIHLCHQSSSNGSLCCMGDAICEGNFLEPSSVHIVKSYSYFLEPSNASTSQWLLYRTFHIANIQLAKSNGELYNVHIAKSSAYFLEPSNATVVKSSGYFLEPSGVHMAKLT